MENISSFSLPWNTINNTTRVVGFTISPSPNYSDFSGSTEGFNVSTNVSETEGSTRWTPREIARFIHIIVRPILIVFGTIGNGLTFYIMGTTSLKKRSVCFYMAVLALTDTGE